MKTFSRVPAESKLNTVECKICGSVKSAPLWNGKIPFVRCSNCGLVFQNPQPQAEQLFKRYDSEYFSYEIENEENFFNLMKLGLSDVDFFQEEARILSSCSDSGTKPVFVDVGCATGCLLQAMRERGWDVKGVEICRQSAEYGRKHRLLDIYNGPVEDAGFADSSVDVLHCSHLIEHLTDPAAFTVEVARILKPGGIVVVVTPDISGFQARLFGEKWRSAIADHMFLFSRKTLGLLLKNSGFRVLKSASWGGLAEGTAPRVMKKAADRLAKRFGFGDVICLMGMKHDHTLDTLY